MIKCIDFWSNPKTKMRLRKGFNKHQCLTHIIEKYLNTGGHDTGLLAYLCMAFNYIDHQQSTIDWKINCISCGYIFSILLSSLTWEKEWGKKEQNKITPAVITIIFLAAFQKVPYLVINISYVICGLFCGIEDLDMANYTEEIYFPYCAEGVYPLRSISIEWSPPILWSLK